MFAFAIKMRDSPNWPRSKDLRLLAARSRFEAEDRTQLLRQMIE
jgi:SOS response regulatory protein OraA/RecX